MPSPYNKTNGMITEKVNIKEDLVVEYVTGLEEICNQKKDYNPPWYNLWNSTSKMHRTLLFSDWIRTPGSSCGPSYLHTRIIIEKIKTCATSQLVWVLWKCPMNEAPTKGSSCLSCDWYKSTNESTRVWVDQSLTKCTKSI